MPNNNGNSMADFFWGKTSDGRTTCLGRTASSWAKIGFFYLVYYTFLAFLAYGTIAWYQSTVEDEKTPYIRTRTGQPGMAAEPADSVIEDNNNQNFEFNTKDVDSFKLYIDRSIEFLKGYSDTTQKQFSKEILEDAMKEKSVYYFLKVNKINGWTPIGFKSPKQMAGAGYHDDDGAPVLTFENGKIQQEDGVYFFCNASTPTTFEFQNLNDYNVQLVRPKTPTNYGFIPKKEYEQLNKEFEERRKWEKIGSRTAPFVAVKITAETNDINKITCYSIAQNIQVQRHINVGFYEFGFQAK